MRNLTVDIVTTVEPTGMVSFACPPPSVGVKGLLSVPTVAVVDVPQRASARLRPSLRQWAALGRIAAEGAGYGFGGDLVTGRPDQWVRGAGRRPAAATAAAQYPAIQDPAVQYTTAQRTTSTARNARSTQSKQLHLMSRRDPCSWRPPV